MKYKKVILIPPYILCGDCFSVLSLVYYLLEYYEQVYLYIGQVPSEVSKSTIDSVTKYIEHFFLHDPLFNNKIQIIDSDKYYDLVNSGGYGDYHVCNTLTNYWSEPSGFLKELGNINKEFYFNDENPITNKLNIPKEHICSPNKHLPIQELSINHIIYYELIGLNNKVRMDYFNYIRNIEYELEVKKNILNSYNILDGNYNIVNDPNKKSDNLIPYIKNSYPSINIDYLSDNPCHLITLLEGAKSINFIEGSNVNFFYHAQYKGIFKYSGDINFHIWLRNRDWSSINLDYAWKMMSMPKLDNWKFIFTPTEI